MCASCGEGLNATSNLKLWSVMAVVWVWLYFTVVSEYTPDYSYANLQRVPNKTKSSRRPDQADPLSEQQALLCANGTLSAIGDVCCPAHCTYCGRHGGNATLDLDYIENSWESNYWGEGRVVTDERRRYPSEPGCGIRSMHYENRLCNASGDTACVMPNLQQPPIVSDCCNFFPNLSNNASSNIIITFSSFMSKALANLSNVSCGLSHSNKFLSYRLGDMVNNRAYRPKLAAFHLANFPESIASEFVRRYPNNYSLIPELSEIIDRKFPKPTMASEKSSTQFLGEHAVSPSTDTVVVHLRTGDVRPLHARRTCQIKRVTDTGVAMYKGPPLDDDDDHCGRFAPYLIDSLCVEASFSKYLRPLSYYREIIAILSEQHPHVRNVVICSGLHIEYALIDYDMCCANIAAVKLLFETFGFTTTVRMSGNPDADIAFMSRASFFVASGGGYSRTVSKLVVHNKGVVFTVGDWFHRTVLSKLAVTSPGPHGVKTCDLKSKLMVHTIVNQQTPPTPTV